MNRIFIRNRILSTNARSLEASLINDIDLSLHDYTIVLVTIEGPFYI